MRDETTDKAGEAWRPGDRTQMTSFELYMSSKVDTGFGNVNFNVSIEVKTHKITYDMMYFSPAPAVSPSRRSVTPP